MEYPQEILPHSNYKIIDCNLSGFLLIRFTNTKDKSVIWNAETNSISQDQICHPSEKIEDLSMSLLGYYTPKHIFIDFTPAGKAKFMKPWDLNQEPDIPLFGTEFFHNNNKHFWWVSIAKLNNQTFKFESSEGPRNTTCHVCHTPMFWNFWHFSLKWSTEDGPLADLKGNKWKKAARRIGHAVRVVIAQNASIEEPRYELLSTPCFTR